MPVRRSAWIKFVTDNRKSNESYGEALHRLAPEWHRRQSAAGIPTSRKRRPSRARRGVFTRSKSRSRPMVRGAHVDSKIAASGATHAGVRLERAVL